MKHVYVKRGSLELRVPIGDISAQRLESAKVLAFDEGNNFYYCNTNTVADLLFATHIARSELDLEPRT